MSLTTRLCAFFLAALALVLAGFSATLYSLASRHLSRQVEERLTAGLDTLAAAAEIESGKVEWEPQQRRITLGQEPGEDQVRWIIRTEDGKIVDQSRNLLAEGFRERNWPASTEEEADLVVRHAKQPWWIMQRRVRAEPGAAAAQTPQAGEQRIPNYDLLVLTTATSLAPLEATLRKLAMTLAGLSGGLWIVAAFGGRWLSRRALIPMTRMAATARAMNAVDWDQRLPSPGTGDELEDLSKAFNGLLARLHEAYERQRRFTGDASHQLRTPLTAVLGQIEVALRRDRSPAEYRQVLARVQGQADHLHHLVEMLLFLARPDAEAMLPDLEAVELTSWLDQYVSRWSQESRAGDLRVEHTADGSLCVRVQSQLLTQLFDNLLDNACKYSKPGTPITMVSGREGDHVFCSVVDAGSGISAEDLPHIFEPFYRSADVRRAGCAGVGLGLSIVQRIAHALGGSIRVQSVCGHGSRFTLHLPEFATQPNEANAEVAQSLSRAQEQSGIIS
jgi:heavy metal sensor kinase